MKSFILAFCLLYIIYMQLQLYQCSAAKCSRIIMEYTVLANQVPDQVVYIRTNLTNNGFPVFEDERGGESYFTAGNRGFWYYSKGSVDYRSGFTGFFSETRVNMTELDTGDGSTEMNLKYCPKESRNKYGSACLDAPSIQADKGKIYCVPHMTYCGDNRIAYFQGNKRILLEKTNKRTYAGGVIYENCCKEFRLFHKKYGNKWILMDIKFDRNSIINEVSTVATRPEYIVSRWYWDEFNQHTLIECQGDYQPYCSPCLNSGICHTNSVKSTWCTCKYGYHGKSCEFNQTQTTTTAPTTTATVDIPPYTPHTNSTNATDSMTTNSSKSIREKEFYVFLLSICIYVYSVSTFTLCSSYILL